MLPKIPLPQRDTPELLDEKQWPLAETRRSLRDIERINRFLGGYLGFEKRFWSLARNSEKQQLKVLDLGCGSGDLGRRLISQGEKRGVKIEVLGLDFNARHLQIAREKPVRGLEFLQADAFDLPLQNGSVDFVVSTLFLHHFRPTQIEKLIRETQRVARIGGVMNDLERDAVALWSFRLMRPFFARSFLTRFDAVASLRRAYTTAEIESMARISGAQSESCFPYRWNLWWKNENRNL